MCLCRCHSYTSHTMLCCVLCRPTAAAGQPTQRPDSCWCRAQTAEAEVGSRPAAQSEGTATAADAACKMHRSLSLMWLSCASEVVVFLVNIVAFESGGFKKWLCHAKRLQGTFWLYGRHKNANFSRSRFYQVSPKLSVNLLQITNIVGSGILKIWQSFMIVENRFIFVTCHRSQDLLTVTGTIS